MPKVPNALRLVALLMLAGTPAAMAQNALGDGRKLERQLELTDRWQGNVPRADFSREVRLRNALVTGNAGGGRSLQINAPYRDQDDFRGALGSDSLFRFRRDSFGAGGMGNIGFRGTEGLQYQYDFASGLSTSNRLASRGVGNVPATTAGAVSAPPPVAKRPAYESDGSDLAAPALGTLRSTSAFAANRGLSPALVGYTSRRDGITRVTASPLLGVRNDLLVPDPSTGRYAEVERNPNAPGQPVTGPKQPDPVPSAYDAMRATLDAKPLPRYETPPDVSPKPSTDDRKTDKPSTDVSVPEMPKQPAGIVAPTAPGSNAKPPETTPAPTPDPAGPKLSPWEERMQLLSDRISGKKPPVRKPTDEDLKDSEGRARLVGLDEVTLQIIRDTALPVDGYVKEFRADDVFSLHVSQGQSLLAQGRYFDAEERFARALAVRAGEPAAQAARVHAQLGAGLYMSASLNLRRLLEGHPEMMAVKYAPALLPPEPRLSQVIQEQRDGVRAMLLDGQMRPENGFLLAYLGFQRGDAEDIALGFRGIARANEVLKKAAADKGEPPPHDLLADVLEQVWLVPTLPPVAAPSK